ncbi:DNA topoisomerase 4 subunit A [Mycoplasma cottewii]|uniref:DNA topoisomerase 4 subunit A n=1 Tax=Mycoplasma cottewii TaxID=51364 RepID=A0ABY5TXK5_9MOLU|nr:DNA topoisomerase 4 subunit A [Mycoplasma cottewii]
MSQNNKGIISYPLEQVLGDRFGRYAKYIIQERALPDVRDGLKPVQRRILFAMNELNLTFDKPYKKSARVVGEVIGKYHPHGDSSIYEAMVRMSQDWKLNNCLVDMQGNNGSIDGDSAAAMRYTEARLAKISNLLLEDLDKETVLMAPNFDDSETEPTVLPGYFPNILVNGATGIAAGYATNMPPHNLGEIIDATIKIIKNENTRLDTILDIVKGPDFPTGGVIQNKEGIKDAFLTGKGKVIISSKWHQENNDIVIDEIPYEVVKQDLVRKIGDVIDSNSGLGIKEVRDETDRKGLRIVIQLNEKANLETVRKYLFKNTPLSVSYNYNNIVIVDKQPKQLGLIDIIKAYITHYKQVFTKRTQFNLNKANNRLEIVLGLIKALSILDQIIELIRKSENRNQAIENLINKFKFTKNQATAIVDMRLYRLTSTDVEKLNQEKDTLNITIKHLQDILNNKEILDQEIINRLKEVKKLLLLIENLKLVK